MHKPDHAVQGLPRNCEYEKPCFEKSHNYMERQDWEQKQEDKGALMSNCDNGDCVGRRCPDHVSVNVELSDVLVT